MNKVIEEMKKHPRFTRFCLPIDTSEDFRDATYFLNEDGNFIFSEGYYHQIEKPLEDRMLNGHYFYVPLDPNKTVPDYSKKTFFDQKFENITKEIMNTQPLELLYPTQLAKYIDIDPSQKDVERPVYAAHKTIVPVTSLIGCFPHRNSLQAIMEKADEDPSAQNIKTIAEHTADLLGIDVSQLGISGSLALGTYADPHDLDFVIYGTTAEIKRIVDFMYDLTDKNDDRKVYEFGKFWPIRFWDWAGDEKFMVCPFFSYLDPDESPMRNFDCEELGEVVMEARISDDTHNATNPTFLGVVDVKIDGVPRPSITHLIIHHGAERGDWRRGFRVRVKGHHVLVKRYKMVDGKREPIDQFEAVFEDNFGDVKKIG